MSHPASSELLTALSDEKLAVQAFVDLLQQEQRLLTENSTDELQLLAEQKSAHVQHLNELTENTMRVLAKYIEQPDHARIVSWLAANDIACLSLWQDIYHLAGQSRELNRVNGELIQMKLRHNQQSLTALTSAVAKTNVYGPDGQTNFSPGSGRSLGSV